jgi:hypothetical protein
MLAPLHHHHRVHALLLFLLEIILFPIYFKEIIRRRFFRRLPFPGVRRRWSPSTRWMLKDLGYASSGFDLCLFDPLPCSFTIQTNLADPIRFRFPLAEVEQNGNDMTTWVKGCLLEAQAHGNNIGRSIH